MPQILDRKIAPEIVKPVSIPFPKVITAELRNGLKCYCIEAGTQDICKIEVVFKAGTAFQTKPLLASAVNGMLTEGTLKKTGAEIADYIDKFGAYLSTDITKDRASVSLLCLNKHLGRLVPTLTEVCLTPSFLSTDLTIFARNAKQRLLVNLQDVNFRAQKHVNRIIFNNTTYQNETEPEDYDNLKSEDLHEFYKEHYGLRDAYVIITGKNTLEAAEKVQHSLGSVPIKGENNNYLEEFSIEFSPELYYYEDLAALQSAIRIGRPMPVKSHPEYFGLKVLNTILGGYFGSRLMRNIREDKGYTYGISSVVASMEHCGYFFIGTQVGAEFTFLTIEEIYKEINNLQNELVSEDELELVKSYMLGSLQKAMDGPFAIADRFKEVVDFDLDVDFYQQYALAINNITAEEIRYLAKTYLNRDQLAEIIVGNKGGVSN